MCCCGRFSAKIARALDIAVNLADVLSSRDHVKSLKLNNVLRFALVTGSVSLSMDGAKQVMINTARALKTAH